MENKRSLIAATLCAAFSAASVQAQDLAGIGYADFSTDAADVGLAQDPARDDAMPLLVFIDPDDASVRIAQVPADDAMPPALSGLIGFAVRADFDAIIISDTGVEIDVDGNGEFVSLATCLTTEGVRLIVTSSENEVLWSLTRSLPYDTEASCTD